MLGAEPIEVSCNVETCIYNSDRGTCNDPGGISIVDMCSCIEVQCGYEAQDIDEDEDEEC
jgi:hypothetical protein